MEFTTDSKHLRLRINSKETQSLALDRRHTRNKRHDNRDPTESPMVTVDWHATDKP